MTDPRGPDRIDSLSATEPVPPTNESTAEKVFYGPNGLRAGWRLSIFALILTVPVVLLQLLAHLAAQGHPPAQAQQPSEISPMVVAWGEFVSFVLICIAAAIMGRIENRQLAHYGLAWRSPFPKHFWVGLGWGFLAISSVLLLMSALHGFRILGFETHGAAALVAAGEWGVVFLLVGFFEEFAFRGYALFTLTTGIGFWPSAIILSGLFAYVHTGNEGETALGIAQVFLFGVLACLALQRTGNLWWPIGFHAAWDWGQTYFYGVPDSGLPSTHALLHTEFHGPNWLTGGTTGPEASVLTLAVLLIACVLVAWRYREAHYPDPEALGPRPRA